MVGGASAFCTTPHCRMTTYRQYVTKGGVHKTGRLAASDQGLAVRQCLERSMENTSNLQYLTGGVIIKSADLQHLIRGWSYDNGGHTTMGGGVIVMAFCVLPQIQGLWLCRMHVRNEN